MKKPLNIKNELPQFPHTLLFLLQLRGCVPKCGRPLGHLRSQKHDEGKLEGIPEHRPSLQQRTRPRGAQRRDVLEAGRAPDEEEHLRPGHNVLGAGTHHEPHIQGKSSSFETYALSWKWGQLQLGFKSGLYIDRKSHPYYWDCYHCCNGSCR